MNGLEVTHRSMKSKKNSSPRRIGTPARAKMAFEGTPLSGKDFEKGKFLYTTYKPQLQYAWDTGRAVGRYLQGLKEGRLLGVRCRNCERTVIPPRAFCERCFRPIEEWVELQDRGTINTFSISYVRWDAVRLEKPTLPAVIDIEGTSPKVGILHLLGEVDPQQIKVGMKVKAVWKPEAERIGAITDIQYFKPE